MINVTRTLAIVRLPYEVRREKVLKAVENFLYSGIITGKFIVEPEHNFDRFTLFWRTMQIV